MYIHIRTHINNKPTNIHMYVYIQTYVCTYKHTDAQYNNIPYSFLGPLDLLTSDDYHNSCLVWNTMRRH